MKQEFNNVDKWVLHDMFLSLQKHKESFLRVEGGNSYSESYLSKKQQRSFVEQGVSVVYYDEHEYDRAVKTLGTS